MELLEKLRKIEELIARAGTEGEKQAAIFAKERLEKLRGPEQIEYTIHTADMWHKKLFNAVCHKYGLKPYRYHRQKYTTVMVMVNKPFLNEVVWPEYLKFAQMLEGLVNEVTNEVISKIHKDESETIINGELEEKHD